MAANFCNQESNKHCLPNDCSSSVFCHSAGADQQSHVPRNTPLLTGDRCCRPPRLSGVRRRGATVTGGTLRTPGAFLGGRPGSLLSSFSRITGLKQ